MYGPNDNFNLDNSHVLPALIRKFHEAKTAGKKEVLLWGTGNARREFLYVDDLAEALLFLLENYHEKEFINIGSGEDISIHDLATLIQKIVGYEGTLVFDPSKPEGVPRKLLDISRITSLGWQPRTSFEEGLKKTYAAFLSKHN